MTRDTTILFVEDEDPVRIFAVQALSGSGYKVLEAANGEEALKIVEDRGKEIDIIVTDAIMPGISGLSLVTKIRKTYPNVKVLFTSGYTEESLPFSIKKFGGTFNFLSKPFSLGDLITKVEEILKNESYTVAK